LNCTYCEEPVEPGEQNECFQSQPMHVECGFRLAAGSLAHIEGRCSCYVPGATELDPPGMTKREAARASLHAYRKAMFYRLCDWRHLRLYERN